MWICDHNRVSINQGLCLGEASGSAGRSASSGNPIDIPLILVNKKLSFTDDTGLIKLFWPIISMNGYRPVQRSCLISVQTTSQYIYVRHCPITCSFFDIIGLIGMALETLDARNLFIVCWGKGDHVCKACDSTFILISNIYYFVLLTSIYTAFM